MTSKRSHKQEDINFRILTLIEEYPEISQREISNRLGLSLGGVNYCIKSLVEKGWVKAQNFNHSKNKLSYMYLLTPLGFYEKIKITSAFLSRKMKEYEALKKEINALSLKFKSIVGFCQSSK